MRNLLSANFLRLRKSVLFWGLLAVSFGLGALIAFNYYEMSREESIPLDGAFFSYPILACILTAVFIPLFLGAEYSGGAIRSKVAAGHSRPLIYGANLLAGMAASALFCGAYMLAALTVGTPLIGFLAADAQQAALLTLGSLAAMAAFCALFTLAAMNCSRKSVSAVVCVLGVFLLLLAAVYVRSRLLAPEYLNGFWNARGEFVPGVRPTPNIWAARRGKFLNCSTPCFPAARPWNTPAGRRRIYTGCRCGRWPSPPCPPPRASSCSKEKI